MEALPRLARFLDPRSAREAAARPISDSVNIPFAELPDRMHELPSREELILVAGPDETVAEVVEWLRNSERLAEPAKEWTYGEERSKGRLWRPNEFLMEVLPSLQPGLAIDLGCGGGREAIALAAAGWNVVAVDRLAKAVERGQVMASRYLSDEAAMRIDWRVLDLRRERLPNLSFDLAVMFFYLNRELLRALPGRLRVGGSVILETFTVQHREARGKPSSDELVLAEDELSDLLPGLTVRQRTIGWHHGRHTARVWALAEAERVEHEAGDHP